MIVLTRIDDRLIHGQVVEGWVNFLKATCIFVADDTVASNAFQCSIMQVSAPQGLKVCIGGVREICAEVCASAFAEERVILLFSNPSDALRALKLGLGCTAVNIGGMHYTPNKCKLMDVLAVDDADREALKAIMDMGVSVTIQTVPTEKPLPLGKVLGGVCKTS
jgi:mannose/fructose/N-acetylgalactosamine-specific phosphotransferase system component IIB